jgi:demethylmenaquinone methyltransferase/2-methoxy-6-polyprenyl-1,4-benzoquinol methylase
MPGMPAAADIRSMFSAISGRYDLLNRVLSLGTDRSWRRRTCELLGVAPGMLAADLCCGTGDLALALAARGARVVAADFSHEMLARAAAKGTPRVTEADSLKLPFRDATFDRVTVGFGARNLQDLRAGLAEIHRVLKPGGVAGILEFARPTPAPFRILYHTYLKLLVPALGALLSGKGSAYSYLSSSIRDFPDQSRMTALLLDSGFAPVRHVDFARGIAALYIAQRSMTS